MQLGHFHRLASKEWQELIQQTVADSLQPRALRYMGLHFETED